MHDPVVVVETGQVYDEVSIRRWFGAGNNTCPLTGVSLSSQRLTRLPKLQAEIGLWAKQNGVQLEPPERVPSEKREFVELDNPCQSLSLVTSKGVSVYDPEAVVKLLSRQAVPETYAALVVLRELVKHSDEQQFKRISDLIDIDFLNCLLNEDELKKPAARLLVVLKKTLNVDELTHLLTIPDIDLQVNNVFKMCPFRTRFFVFR